MEGAIVPPEIVSAIIHFAPDTVLCSFLLVTARTRQLALVECKRRSRVPHLWDVPKDDLVLTLHREPNLAILVHVDYCLCVYLGFASHDGISEVVSEDLVRLALRMGIYPGFSFYEQVARFGLDDIWDLLPNNAYKEEAAKYNSLSVHISGENTGPKRDFFNAVRERDIQSLRKMPQTHITIKACDMIAAWLVHRDDLEVAKIIAEKVPKFASVLKNHAAQSVLPSKIARHYDAYTRFAWCALDVNPHTRVICVDDPGAFSNKISATDAKKSCCLKVLKSLGVPFVVSAYICEDLMWIFEPLKPRKAVIIAAIRKAPALALCKLLEMPTGEQLVLDYVPGGRQFLADFYSSLVAKYQGGICRLMTGMIGDASDS